MTANIYTRASSVSLSGDRRTIAPLVAHRPFTEAAIANHKRRLRLELARIEAGI